MIRTYFKFKYLNSNFIKMSYQRSSSYKNFMAAKSARNSNLLIAEVASQKSLAVSKQTDIKSNLRSQRPASAVSSRRLRHLQQAQQNTRPQSGVRKNPNQELQRVWLSKKGLDEPTARLIWDAFGQYVAKTLKQRRGVIVPKFGLFTFSVNEKKPVFVISKDFGAGSFIRPAIVNAGNQLRPFEAAVADGSVPQIKANYFEVATLTNGRAGKDACKTQCETMFNHGAEKIRGGQQITELIPHVGRLTVRNGLAAVIFDSDLINVNQQLTAQREVKAEKPPLPLKINKALNKLDIDLVQDAKSRAGNDASSRLFAARNASGKENQSRLQNISHGSSSFQKALDQMGDSSIRKLVQKNRAGSSRPMSAYERSQAQIAHRSNRSSAGLSSIGSRASFISTMSKIPELPPFQLMHMANEIYARGVMIIQKVQGKETGVQSLRDVISSSQIYKILSKTGLRFPIGDLKALLKELGFNWNGPSCSIAQLLTALKKYLNPQSSLKESQSEITYVDIESSQKTAVLGQSLKPRSDLKTLLKLKHEKGQHAALDIIKDVFYQSGKILYEIYREKVTGNRMDFQAFFELVCKYSQHQITAQDCKEAFDYVCEMTISPETPHGKDWLSFNDFQQYFYLYIPDPQKFQDENKVILIVKDWMAEKGYSSDQAFEMLLTSVNRKQQKSFRRYDFQKAIAANAIKITAPEVDHFFDYCTGFKKLPTTLLGERNWKTNIIDEGGGPLLSLRKLVRDRGLGKDQLLKIMQLRLWDYGLDYKNFVRALLKLEPSLTDHLCITFFERLQGNDNLVEVPILINNLCGTEHDTVDYKIKMLKDLYTSVFGKGRQDEFIKLCEIEDKRNEGKVEPEGMEKVIKKITGSQYTDEIIKKFVQQLHKDPCNGRISYLQFVDTSIGFGNKNHNPFKQLVMKIELFMMQKGQDAGAFMKSAGADSSESISIEKFVQFLKRSVDKDRNLEQIQEIAKLMDIDKDGFICSNDLATCVKHLDHEVFFKDGGKVLQKPQFNAKEKFFMIDAKDQISNSKIIEVCGQIRRGMEQKEYSPEDLFNGFDADGDGMLTIAEFSRGIISIVPISNRILQRLFSLMDQQQIGMVPFESFKNVLDIKVPIQLQWMKKENKVEDDFSWQEDTIKAIRKFVRLQEMTSADAFRLFDQDFDGQVSKKDMSTSIQQYLEIPEEKITDHRLSRLFRLLSFYKTDTLQPSDFERLLVDINPYLVASQGQVKADFKKALGGVLPTQSTRDWKIAAIQQLGVVLSQKYPNLSDSFKDASKNTSKINFAQFAAFIEKTNSLEGFNLSREMLLILFAEMDPHKKTYLSERDWLASLGTFSEDKMLLVEFKNYLQCQFSDVMSAYGFFQTFDEEAPLITFPIFTKALKSLIKNRKYTEKQMMTIYKSLLKDPSETERGFSFKSFGYEFEMIKFRGRQTIQTVPNPNGKGGYITTIKTAINPEWEKDIINRLRATMSAAGKSIERIFADMDEDGNGIVTQKEFRNGIRKLGIGLTSKQIDQIMVRIDENGDGVIDYGEFFAILGERQGLDHKMVERAKNKLADLKEKMQKYMGSHGDAYRAFDSSKVGKMQFQDFNKLMLEICRISNSEIPCYAVIKDLFDAVDIKKDGNIDLAEWNQSFNSIQGGGPQSSMAANPMAGWDNSKESNKIGELINKQRKILLSKFKEESSGMAPDGKTKVVNFKQAKKALADLLFEEFTSKNQPISDSKLKMVLSCCAIPDPNKSLKEPLYDFAQMLDLFKQRYQGKV